MKNRFLITLEIETLLEEKDLAFLEFEDKYNTHIWGLIEITKIHGPNKSNQALLTHSLEKALQSHLSALDNCKKTTQ